VLGLDYATKGKNVVKILWVYKTIFSSQGIIEKHKDQLVENEFCQQEVVNYTKAFSPIAKMKSMKVILSLATCFARDIH
jgi:hypothetical protein